jgi:aconitate hydratase
VAIGSCTNSSYRDLKLVATILQGRTIHPDVSFVIAPGSRQVLSMLAKDGSLGDMIGAGARILEVACGPCIGMGQAPPSDGVSVRTFNRNFPGRSGTPDGHVYLASPQVAVAAALAGHIVHPAELGDLPNVSDPETFLVDDSMIIPPPDKTDRVTIRMGPNIKPLPESDQLPDYLKLKLLLKLGDNITTDDILPGGSKVLPLRSNIPEISRHVYAVKAPGFAEKALSQGDVAILGGENYGQGSSREHAALAARFLGVRLLLAKSFARLHRANLINFGVLPVLLTGRGYNQMEENDEIELVGLREAMAEQGEIIIKLMNKDRELIGRLDFSQRERKILLAGGRLNAHP